LLEGVRPGVWRGGWRRCGGRRRKPC
jgi:hypothetical protein